MKNKIQLPHLEIALYFNRSSHSFVNRVVDYIHEIYHSKLPEDAKMVANWNPYDQNNYSPFFDTEWMFGLPNGFDIVIGNPPFIAGKSGIFNEKEKKYFNNKYETAEYQLDTYILFTEKDLKICNSKGITSFILPNTFKIHLDLLL